MRYLPALALLVSTLSIPAFGQRGGGMHGGGGFSGGGMRSGGVSGGMRSGGGPSGGMRSGGFTASRVAAGSRIGSPYARYGGAGSYGRTPYGRTPYGRTPYGARPSFYSRNGNFTNGSNRYPGNYRNRGYGYGYPGFYGLGYGYGYPFYDSFLDFDNDPVWGDDYGSANSSTDPNLADNGQYAQPGDAQAAQGPQPVDLGPYAYPAQPYPQAAQPSYMLYPAPGAYANNNPPPEDATTLVFKDGRPSIQVRNYALTRTALYITGPKTFEIPVDQLDLPATVLINQQAGKDFQLP